MKRYILTFFALLLLMTVSAQNQGAKCGTIGYNEWLKEYLSNPKPHSARNLEAITYLPLTIHSVGQDDGSGHFHKLRILEAICILNEDFAAYNIQFFIKGEINLINRSSYADHDDFSDGERMMRTYNKPLTINTYIAASGPSGVCGYFTPSQDAIVILKGCLGSGDHTWAHEVGHFLALPHTFYGWEGQVHDPDEPTPLYLRINGRDTLYVEGANGEFCKKGGDGFCDTPADYLSDGWQCGDDYLSKVVQKDPDGKEFRSDGKNFMSYANNSCQSEFSLEQTEAMHSYIETSKAFYVSDAIPVGPVSQDPMTFISPDPGALVNYQSIQLKWDHQVNATKYLVNISIFSFFATVDYEFITEGNSINIGDLPVDKKFYWRVKPFNPYETCGRFTDAGSFTTYDVTAVDELDEKNLIELYPTLISASNPRLQIEFDFSDILRADIQVVSYAGQAMLHQTYINPGRRREELDLSGLSPGIYIVRVSTSKGTLIKRIAIQ